MRSRLEICILEIIMSLGNRRIFTTIRAIDVISESSVVVVTRAVITSIQKKGTRLQFEQSSCVLKKVL